MDHEWAAIAQEQIRQIKSGEVAPLDGALEEMRQLAKQLAQQWVSSFILTLETNFASRLVLRQGSRKVRQNSHRGNHS
jgi:hypothetical protein